MFCPEDGTEIPMIDSSSPRVPDSYHAYYDPCSECGAQYWYDGDEGVYRTGGPKILSEEGECSGPATCVDHTEAYAEGFPGGCCAADDAGCCGDSPID